MGAAAGPNIIEDGLVLALDAGNTKSYPGSGTAWTDTVGGNTGTLNGPHHTEPFVGAGYVEFDGTGDNLSISSASSLGGFSGDFTIEFWFKGDNQTGFDVFLESWISSTSSAQRWAIQAEGSGTTNMIWVRDGDIKFTTSGIDAFDNAWHHHAVVRNGSTINYYIDGVSRGSESHSASLSSGTDFIIGKYSAGGYEIEGYLSNVRIVDGTAVYTSNFTPPTKSLTAVPNTVLLTCQGNTIADASSSALSITTGGDAEASNVSAFEFDGSNSNDYIQLSTNSNLTLTGDFTYETWIQTDVQTGSKHVWKITNATLQFTNSFSPDQLAYYSSATGTISFGILNNNTWGHVVITKSGNTVTGYLNGSQAWTNTPGSSDTHDFSGVRIGSRHTESGYYWDGRMSVIRIYNKAFTAAEVEQNYNATKGRYA